MERRGMLKETGRGHGGHEPRMMGQLYKWMRDGEREKTWVLGVSPVSSFLLP